MAVPLPRTVERRSAMSRDRDQTLSDLNAVSPSHVADRVEAHLDGQIQAGFYDGPRRAPANVAEHFAHMMADRHPLANHPGFAGLDGHRDLGRALLATATWQGDSERARQWLGETYGEDSTVYGAMGSALGSSTVEAGGTVVEAGVRDQYIDLLVPQIAVMQLGPVPTPMPEGSLTIHEVTADVSAHYVGEDRVVQVSRPGTGSRKMTAKTLKVSVPIPNSYIRRARKGARGGFRDIERMIQRLAVRRGGIKKDMTFLRSMGTDNTPRGLRYWAHGNNVFPASASAGFVDVLRTLGSAISRMEDADVIVTRPGWILRARDKNFLAYECLSDDRPFFLEMISRGQLLNGPFATSSLVPGKLGAQGDASEIYLADFEMVLVGDSLNLMMKVTDGGTYYDGGQLVSADARDETLLTLTEEHDLHVEHREAVVVVTDVRWSAPI